MKVAARPSFRSLRWPRPDAKIAARALPGAGFAARALCAFALILAPVVALGPTGRPSVAEASVARALSLEELVGAATHVVVATPIDRSTTWEEIGGSKRIVTYTRLSIDRTVVGAPRQTVWVRTLGGVVGKIGQSVSGEAQLAMGEKAVLFLFEAGALTVVAGRAQGHFPIGDAGHLRASPDVGGLLPQRGPAAATAREVLVGAHVDAALATVVRAKADRHAP